MIALIDHSAGHWVRGFEVSTQSVFLSNRMDIPRRKGAEFATLNTVCSQKNGAVSKVNKKFISYLTRAQSTPSAAATVQVSRTLITI
jgi:hypothetical protein